MFLCRKKDLETKAKKRCICSSLSVLFRTHSANLLGFTVCMFQKMPSHVTEGQAAGRCIWFPWNSIECLSLINLTTFFFLKSACILLIYKKQGAVRSDFMKMIYKPDCQKWRVLRQTNGQKLRADRRRGFRWKRRNNSPQQGSHYLDLQVTVRSQEIPKCFPHFLSYILCQISCNWNHKPSYCWTLFWRKGDSLTLPYEHLITQFLPV